MKHSRLFRNMACLVLIVAFLTGCAPSWELTGDQIKDVVREHYDEAMSMTIQEYNDASQWTQHDAAYCASVALTSLTQSIGIVDLLDLVTYSKDMTKVTNWDAQMVKDNYIPVYLDEVPNGLYKTMRDMVLYLSVYHF